MSGRSVEDLIAERVVELLLPRLVEQQRAILRDELPHVPAAEDQLWTAKQAAAEGYGNSLKPVALLRRAERGSFPPGVVVRQGRRIYFRSRALLGYAATERRGR